MKQPRNELLQVSAIFSSRLQIEIRHRLPNRPNFGLVLSLLSEPVFRRIWHFDILSEVGHRGHDLWRPRNPEKWRWGRLRLTFCSAFSAIFAAAFSRGTSTSGRRSGNGCRPFDFLYLWVVDVRGQSGIGTTRWLKTKQFFYLNLFWLIAFFTMKWNRN